MGVAGFFSRTYYALLFRKRARTLLFEHDKNVDFSLYDTDWKQWYADPIVFKHEGTEWLFVEKMDMLKRKGTIAVAKINENGIGEFTEVLEESFHLSYPLVFSKNGNIYMIPESANEKAIYLYKCVDFPYQWRREYILLQGRYFADTNVIDYNGHWYLLTGEMDPKVGSRTKLTIYNADNIEYGKLSIMSNNQFDFAYNSRGAGSIINHNGKIIRPTQVGDEKRYGIGMNFYSIHINENYKEELINSFSYNRISLLENVKLTGTHTYCLSENFEIIDVQYTRRAHPAIILSFIIRKLKKLVQG